MDQATYLLVRDLLFVALAALGLGLPLYAVLRRTNPLAQGERQGNVWAAPFGIADLLLALALIGFFALPRSAASEDITTQMLWANALSFVFVVAILLLFLALRGIRLVELFGLERMSPQAIFAVSLAFLVLAWVTMVGAKAAVDTLWLARVWPEPDAEQALVQALERVDDRVFRMSVVLVACLIQPVAEEFLFRGYLYGALKRFTDRYFSAIVVSVVFAAVHMHVPALVPLFILAIVLTIAYEMTGSLWVPVTIHVLFNVGNVILKTVTS